jgi:hypothetical protein
LLLFFAIDSKNQAVLRHGARSNGRSATTFPNLDGQLFPGQSTHPCLLRATRGFRSSGRQLERLTNFRHQVADGPAVFG